MADPIQPLTPGMSRRVEQLNSLVLKEVSELVRREVEFPIDTIVTLTRAKVADDAESAKIWVSVLPFDQTEEVLHELQKHIADIQHGLNKRLVMKFVPKIMFTIDPQEEKADHINQVLDQLTDQDLGVE